MEILVDTREQNELLFSSVDGVTVKWEHLPTGDYGARHKDGTMDKTVVERKSIGDLFTSFSGENYLREKEKIKRAKESGLHYILAIEGTVYDIRRGHTYRKGGEEFESKKSGISQVRQILTLLRRGDFKEVWWCRDRTEMAFLIQEYFLTHERMKDLPKPSETSSSL